MPETTAAASRRRPAAKRDAASKATQTKKLADQAIENLSQSLDAGNSDALDAFLKATARFHHYSFSNIMLILSQRPDASRVAGFKTWQSLGRQVRKGEKGIAIFAPMKIKPKDQEGTPKNDEEPQLRFRVVHVFDISQTEGDPLPTLDRVGGDPGAFTAALDSLVRDSGITLEECEDLGGADGHSTGGVIRLRTGLEPAERFSVLVHEFAHERLHQSDTEERPSKTVRETEAEAVAHVVCEAIGLDTGSAAADYIRLYQGDAETLAASLDRIQKTACFIIDKILGEDHDTGIRSTPTASHLTQHKQR